MYFLDVYILYFAFTFCSIQ